VCSMTPIAAGLFSVIILTLSAAPVWAQGKSAFNGTWKMDPARSDLKRGPAPVSRLDRISIDGVNMKDTITQNLRGNEATYDMIYTIDGKECTNHVRGNLTTATAHWEGDELVIDSLVHTFRQAKIVDRYSVSSDGRTMTLHRHMTGAVDADQTLIFDKQ